MYLVFSWIVVPNGVLHTFYTATAKPEQWNTERANFVHYLKHFCNMRTDAIMIATMWMETGVNPS